MLAEFGQEFLAAVPPVVKTGARSCLVLSSRIKNIFPLVRLKYSILPFKDWLCATRKHLILPCCLTVIFYLNYYLCVCGGGRGGEVFVMGGNVGCGYDGVDHCGYDGGNGYGGVGGCFFLFHTVTKVQFNAVMTIDSKMTTKTQKCLISSVSTPHTV